MGRVEGGLRRAQLELQPLQLAPCPPDLIPAHTDNITIIVVLIIEDIY